ncbi:hypothetical protein EsH8_IX_000183 [Colletotrichum jinshuiense]
MQLTTFLALLAPVSIASAYTLRGSTNYCEEARTELIHYNLGLNVCVNLPTGYASYNFVDVSNSYFQCEVYTQSNCQGSAAQYQVGAGNGSSGCRNSPIGWVYSVSCSL